MAIEESKKSEIQLGLYQFFKFDLYDSRLGVREVFVFVPSVSEDCAKANRQKIPNPACFQLIIYDETGKCVYDNQKFGSFEDKGLFKDFLGFAQKGNVLRIRARPKEPNSFDEFLIVKDIIKNLLVAGDASCSAGP